MLLVHCSLTAADMLPLAASLMLMLVSAHWDCAERGNETILVRRLPGWDVSFCTHHPITALEQ